MHTSYDNLWSDFLANIKEQISPSSYDTWFSTTEAELINSSLVIITQEEFIKEWLNSNYLTLIHNNIYSLLDRYHLDRNLKIDIISKDERSFYEETLAKEKHVKEASPGSSFSSYDNSLFEKYTFENFVIGGANRFAHAAALAVAENPSKSYNPLFIYGGVGLGKTHLMQAIGNHIRINNRSLNVAYLSSERFTNEFINSIRDNKTEEFRNRYRNIDILLIDDIQFLAGKEQTQEEFFHTFNSLHEAGKQIVISSDRNPKEIPTLEERLRSRFSWGLTTDIQAPDLETRVAILHKKARADNLDIDDDVLLYIATRVSNNIRELEGALVRVIAYSSLVNSDINVALAVDALKGILPDDPSTVLNISRIQDLVAKHFNITVEEIVGKKRTKHIVFPRQIAMYLSRELTDNSLPKIGQDFGGRDHTTVIHAYDKIDKLKDTDSDLSKHLQVLKEKLKV